ncbi:hypothetical protein F5B19DRAFT_499910 [Rostrohypoxylon terebratum]|nr:hypothetical protein F5B19DRAFT_499910 [Rostrohypoxylon terebratum]
MSHQEPYSSGSEVYLPGGGGIYVTTTKKGKPAFGRKKKDRLLEDHGFDILGQAFGIPSRIDFERMAEQEVRRRKTFMVRSPPPRTSRGKSTKDHGFYKHESYVFPINKNPLPAFPSAPTRIHRETGSRSSCPSYGKEFETKDANLVPFECYPPPIQSSASPPTWEFGDTIAVPPNSDFLTTPPTISQEHAVQTPVLDSFPKSRPIVASVPYYVQSPLHSASQPVPTPPFFHHIQTIPPYQELRCPIHSTSGPLFTHVPPHQSLLVAAPLSNQPRNRLGTVALNSFSPLRYSPSEVRKCEEHYKSAIKNTVQETNKYESKESERRGRKRDIGKHIQHVHLCAGCGRIRSKRYHSEHPLERGEIPERDYCARCQREAALVEYDDINDTNDDNLDNETYADIPKAYRQPQINMSCTNCSVKQNTKKASGVSKQLLGRISSLSSILTDPTTIEDRTIKLPSVSSTGEASAGEAIQAVDDASPWKYRAPKEDKEASLKNYIHAENSNPEAHVRGEDPKGAVLKVGLKEVLGSAHANDAHVSSEAPSPEGHSGFARPYAGQVSEMRSGTSLQNMFNDPGVASPCYDIPNEMIMPMDEDYRCRDISNRTRDPKAGYSIGHYDNARYEQATGGTCGSVREYKAPYESNVNCHIHEPQARACITPEISQQRRSHRRRVRRHRPGGWEHRYGYEEQYTDNTTELETSHDPKCVSGWDLPPTPTELPHPYQTADPYLTGESWNAYQTGEEGPARGFELMVEEDLLLAAKFFDGMTSPIYGSGASPFPVPDCIAHTEISVESHCSCTEANGPVIPPAAYELYETSELGSTSNEEESRGKTLEFPSKVDRDKEMAQRIDTGTLSTHRNRQKPRERQSETPPKRCEQTYYSDKRASSSSPELSPSDTASSTIVHTGHSSEGLRPDLDDHTDIAVSKHKGIRQLLGL